MAKNAFSLTQNHEEGKAQERAGGYTEIHGFDKQGKTENMVPEKP